MAVKPLTPWPDVTGETGYFPPTIRCRLNFGEDTLASILGYTFGSAPFNAQKPQLWTFQAQNLDLSTLKRQFFTTWRGRLCAARGRGQFRTAAS